MTLRPFYRRVYSGLASSAFRFLDRADSSRGDWKGVENPEVRVEAAGDKRIWFHAASAGELESLWTLVRSVAEEGFDVGLSVFSPSAFDRVDRLREEVEKLRKGSVFFSGPSPREGEWAPLLKSYLPRIFVTAKYESWPDLWASLGQLKIPLLVLGARKRASYRLASVAAGWMQGETPDLYFGVFDDGDIFPLLDQFPKASVRKVRDPRWDRVANRAAKTRPEISAVMDRLGSCPRPWGVLGSVWESDLRIWRSNLSRSKGTLWVVPHEIHSESIAVWKSALESSRNGVVQTTQIGEGPLERADSVIVDEMGFLSELYSYADWAYVGGGFEKGIHNTIEPALSAVPLGTGPRGRKRFFEIGFLQKLGQLEILEDSDSLAEWIDRSTSGVEKTEEFNKSKERWRSHHAVQLGGTEGIRKWIQEIHSGAIS